MKIGIFGGTFNPLHNGHIDLAIKAWSKFQLDKIVFIPSGESYMKDGVLSKQKRYEMVSSALQQYFQFEVSNIETKEDGPSYSYVTLQKLKEQYPEEELYFIIGEDSLASIDKWKKFELIFKLANIIVAKRKETLYTNPFKDKVTDLVCFYNERYGAKIFVMDFNSPISSSRIRELCKKKEKFDDYVPKEIYEYILRYNLYSE